MGISIDQWRIKIGCFSQPSKSIFRLNVLYVHVGRKWRLTFYITTCLVALLLVCGDVERNPGPPKADGSRKSISARSQAAACSDGQSVQAGRTPHAGPGSGEAQIAHGRVTRQTSISSFTASSSQPRQQASPSQDRPPNYTSPGPQDQQDRSPQPAQDYERIHQGTDMFDFLKDMKQDLIAQNARVSLDINSMNLKIDSVLSTVNDLKLDYEKLKLDNVALQNQMFQMQNKLDQYENNSRRNNLRFNGISGKINEQWSVTKQKLRDFLKTTLNFGEEADQIDIDRAHRLRSNDSNTCTIIARFVRFKDCQSILNRATNVLKSNPDSNCSVQQDYSDRVKRHRKILGERMIRERNNGHYASVRFDKLFVNDSIYKYDEETEQIVYIGKRTRPRADASRGHGNYRTDDGRRLVGSQRGNGNVDNGQSHDVNQPIEGIPRTTDDDELSEPSNA